MERVKKNWPEIISDIEALKDTNALMKVDTSQYSASFGAKPKSGGASVQGSEEDATNDEENEENEDEEEEQEEAEEEEADTFLNGMKSIKPQRELSVFESTWSAHTYLMMIFISDYCVCFMCQCECSCAAMCMLMSVVTNVTLLAVAERKMEEAHAKHLQSLQQGVPKAVCGKFYDTCKFMCDPSVIVFEDFEGAIICLHRTHLALHRRNPCVLKHNRYDLSDDVCVMMCVPMETCNSWRGDETDHSVDQRFLLLQHFQAPAHAG